MFFTIFITPLNQSFLLSLLSFYSRNLKFKTEELTMADLILMQESRRILKQTGTTDKESSLLCPIVKILQMRHTDLDTDQATRIVKRVLDE